MRIILICFFGIIGISISFYFLYPIKTITCRNQGYICNERLLTAIGKLNGKSYASIKSGIDKAISSIPSIETSRIDFVFPNKISIVIVENAPNLALKYDNSTEYVLYDLQGKEYEKVAQTNLPVIFVSDYNITKEQLIFGLQTVYEIQRYHEVQIMQLNATELNIKFLNGVVAHFPLEGDIDRLLGSLEVVLSWLNSSENVSRMNEVDFRFRNPVVRHI